MRFCYWFIFIISVTCRIAAGQPVSSQSPAQESANHYEKGKQYLSEGNYLKANEEFKKAEALLIEFR